MIQYELALILRPTLSEKDVQNFAQEMRAMLTGIGATDVAPERTDRRALAYPIKKQTEATYLLLTVTGPTATPERVREELKHRDEVLRMAVTRVTSAPAAPTGPAPAPAPEAANG